MPHPALSISELFVHALIGFQRKNYWKPINIKRWQLFF
jgi:hypothetical protein